MGRNRLAEQERLTGQVRQIIFRSEDSGYTVLRIQPESRHRELESPDGTITVVGRLSHVNEGDHVEFSGQRVENPRFGRQFEAQSARVSKAGSVQDVLRGAIVHVTFYNEDNGWGVVRVVPINYRDCPPDALDDNGTVAVTGIMPLPVESESAEFRGRWIDNPQYGRQFKVEQVIPIAPTTADGIIDYISDSVNGIGPKTARRIYDHFGSDTLEILDSEPERIYEVPGIQEKQAARFIVSWQENRAERRVMIALQSYGLTSRMARRIFGVYGAETLHVLQSDPFQLADDIHGIGFKRADSIARGMGMPLDAPQRLRAGLGYALSQLANDGHTYAPREILIEKAAELLRVEDTEALRLALSEEILAQRLYAENLPNDEQMVEAIYLPLFYHSERKVAHALKAQAGMPSLILNANTDTDWSRFLGELAAKNNVQLSELQQSAVRAALTSKLSVLTGGPGTGKTTTLQMVIHALEDQRFRYALASPTGRAAKRLAEATGREARTIHRLLGWNPQAGGFDFDDDNPLQVDMVIVDESSMIDLVLFNSLLRALDPMTHLMLVGDVDQLPSVGAGNVLKDVINSGLAQVTRLDRIFRQDEDSTITVNAHRINHGEMPHTDNRSSDFFFFGEQDAESAASLVVDIVVNRLPSKFGVDSFTDVQVIAPMYRGAIGVNALNGALQKALNGAPTREKVTIAGNVLRVGDKVMQTRNNYEKEVFNGDIGVITGISPGESFMRVAIDDRLVEYTFDEAEELILAYCISTHRSQGSEYPVVVMPVMKQHYMMLQRNLLYTAITRARQTVVLVGDRAAVGMAVNNNRVSERFSGLLPRLQMG